MLTRLNDGPKKGMNVSLHLFRKCTQIFIIENIFYKFFIYL